MGSVIALSGYKGSGKDTVAEYLVQEHGFIQLSFAKALKDYVSSEYGVPRIWLDDPVLKEHALSEYPVIETDAFTSSIQYLLRDELKSGYWTPRALCILEGSVKRSVYPNFWVSNIQHDLVPENNYVISDMRYRSEADTLRMLLGNTNIAMWRINRFSNITTTDPSERDLDNFKFDHTLDNTGTRERLYATVDGLLDLVLIGRRMDYV